MTIFKIELENKKTGELSIFEHSTNKPAEFKDWYIKKNRRAYLGAETVWVVSRINIIN